MYCVVLYKVGHLLPELHLPFPDAELGTYPGPDRTEKLVAKSTNCLTEKQNTGVQG